MTSRTSLTHPIHITEITHPNYPGKIGVCICPGKKSRSTFGWTWDRDLCLDLDNIQDKFGPTTIITLMPNDELAINKVDTIGEAIIDRGLEWIHLPIKDMSGPDISFDHSWTKVVQKIVDKIQQGEHILVHCKGGLGRSGTIAALLLIELGIANGKAISQVRSARPGAIDIADQEKYILQYFPLSNPAS